VAVFDHFEQIGGLRGGQRSEADMERGLSRGHAESASIS
jgi:hypothetical protein